MVVETVEKKVDIHEQVQASLKEFFDDFECQRCGKCCSDPNAVGVALWRHEFNRLKKLEPKLLRYTFMRNGWHLLKLPCVFYRKGKNPFEKEKCSIYNVRPIACKLYPTAVELDGSLKISENCSALKKE